MEVADRGLQTDKEAAEPGRRHEARDELLVLLQLPVFLISRVGEKTSLAKRNKRQRNKKRSTGPSRVVPHRSTTPARCLTSLFGWVGSGEPG